MLDFELQYLMDRVYSNAKYEKEFGKGSLSPTSPDDIMRLIEAVRERLKTASPQFPSLDMPPLGSSLHEYEEYGKYGKYAL